VTGEAVSRSPDEPRRRQEASAWLTRHESGAEFSAAELLEWDEWLADPNNSAEYDGFVQMRQQLKALPRPSLPTAEELGESRFRGVSDSGSIPSSGVGDARHWRRHGARTVFLAAASVGVVSLVALLAYRMLFVPGSFALDSGHAYTTVVGEQHEFTLADGSVVTLAGGSSLTVRFSATHRTAFLDRGEARFQVQHDRWRPFTVFAGLGSITAVGTVFDVRRYTDRVFVAVTEGAVEVAPQPEGTQGASPAASPETPPWIPLRVSYGEEMTYDAQGAASAARRTDVHLASSWTQGSLVYRGRPLREVIEDVQRYSDRHIVVDPTAADLLYTGTFVEHYVDQWLRDLPRIFPVDVVTSRPNLIVIRSKSLPQQDASIGAAR
jgi:transmembrane sensor